MAEIENKVIKNQSFKAKKEKGDDKFIDSSALGFSWRPNSTRFNLTIDSCKIDGQGASEGLKLSFCRNVVVSNCEIIGGTEDCVDIVRGENIKFENCTFFASSSTKQHITCKGGVKNISFVDCRFIGSFKNWWNGACIDLGNWTDYDDVDRPKVRNINIINCKMQRVGFRLLYRRLHSETPHITKSEGLKFNAPSIFVKAFWYLQRKGLVGKRRRFPKEWMNVYDFEL
jgi:hypothetical protein